MGKFVDLTGQKFGRLTVIERAEDKLLPCGQRRTQWKCRCDCSHNTEIIVMATHLKKGHTKSCGCHAVDRRRKSVKTHGLSHTTIYNEWVSMKQRCYYKGNIGYQNYGGRGITMCDRWRDSFEAFYEDVSKLPHFGEKRYSLDRIDNNGNYEPNNVRWANQKTQANNKRNNHLITYNGKTQTLSQWAEEVGKPYEMLRRRLHKWNWNIERAFVEPIHEEKRNKKRAY